MKLNVKAFALACGLLWGLATFLIAIWAGVYEPAGWIVKFTGNFYLGYETGIMGAIIGFVWGFLDAGIGAAILAWLYNFFCDKFKAA